MKRLLLIATAVLTCAISQAHAANILGWDFTGENTGVATSTAELIDANLTGSGVLSRGSGAAASSANNSFRTTGFANNGIAIANTDYFEFTITAASGYTLQLTSISARFGGTATYSASPGVDMAFAYNTGSGYVLLPTFNFTGNSSTSSNPVATGFVDVSTVAALQNIQTVTFRFYATGQTTGGGWGFNNNNAQSGQEYGLAIDGVVAPVPEPSGALLLGAAALGVMVVRRRRHHIG